MLNQNGFSIIGHKLLSKNKLGRSQLSFLISAEASTRQKRIITKKDLCKRANLLPTHFTRYQNALDQMKSIIGNFKYDNNKKRVTEKIHLYRNGEQYIKVPTVLIYQKRISKHDLGVLLALSIFTSKDKQKGKFNSNVNVFVKKANELFKYKGWDLHLDLSMTYRSVRSLSQLGLLRFNKISIPSKKSSKNAKRKYFFNYITDLRLTSKFWDIATKLFNHTIEESPPDNLNTDESKQETSEKEWKKILDEIGGF